MINPVGPIGKRKIPKYLYHLTKSSNLPYIQQQGLKMGFDDFYGHGVFLFDMANLVKFWNARFGATTLQQKLIKWTSNYFTDEIALLKIPTESIDKAQLVVRRQDKLFKLSQKYNEPVDMYMAYNKGEIPEELMDHITIGTPARFAHKLDGKKAPLEYIYPDKIDPNKLEVIGRGNVPVGRVDFNSVMKSLVKGQPEEKMLDAFA